ncbi:hypothetical protein HGD87_06405 [Rhodobacteraceae bacterium R_SAG9]|nr:hypothetical protein [Rhodobacteraceae bacterium R_SAG9]
MPEFGTALITRRRQALRTTNQRIVNPAKTGFAQTYPTEYKSTIQIFTNLEIHQTPVFQIFPKLKKEGAPKQGAPF